MSRLTAAWRAILHWLEKGDLVPLLIAVSAFHYIAVLGEGNADPWYIAVPVGILVDLGHYRTVRIAARYRIYKSKVTGKPTAKSIGQAILRWGIAVVMTALSTWFHILYYGLPRWYFAVAMPILIMALAYFAQVDGSETIARPSQESTKDAELPQPAMDDSLEVGQSNGDGKAGNWRKLAIALRNDNPEMAQKAIAESCGVAPSTISRYFAELQEEDA